MDAQIEASVRYIEQILQRSFVMTRQPDDINVMQTPSTHRIVSKVSLKCQIREFLCTRTFVLFYLSCLLPKLPDLVVVGW